MYINKDFRIKCMGHSLLISQLDESFTMAQRCNKEQKNIDLSTSTTLIQRAFHSNATINLSPKKEMLQFF